MTPVCTGKHVWDDLYSKCKVTVVVLGRLRYNLVDCHPGQDVLLTSVFGGYIIAGNPFVDTPMAKVSQANARTIFWGGRTL